MWIHMENDMDNEREGESYLPTYLLLVRYHFLLLSSVYSSRRFVLSPLSFFVFVPLFIYSC